MVFDDIFRFKNSTGVLMNFSGTLNITGIQYNTTVFPEQQIHFILANEFQAKSRVFDFLPLIHLDKS